MIRTLAKKFIPLETRDRIRRLRQFSPIPRKIGDLDKRSYFMDVKHLPLIRPHTLPVSNDIPWIDQPNAREVIKQRTDLSQKQKEGLLYFEENGYLIIPSMFSEKEMDDLWTAFDTKYQKGELEAVTQKSEKYPDRPFNPHLKVPEINAFMNDRRIVDWMDLILGEKTKPFQSIVSFRGTDQPAHSDHVHMTTHPVGYLTAIWVAMEDIHPDSGPLEYYPKSHKLPYKFSRDVGIRDDQDALADDYKLYHELYEPFIQSWIKENNVERKLFEAKKGDALIWHANLLHGGSARKDKDLTRRAVVNHYFAEKAFCYHDLAGKMAGKF